MSRRTAGWARRFAGALALVVCVACTPAAPPTPEPVRYVVVKGDTLGKIARAHAVTVEDLRAWNHLTTDVIEIGQVVEIRVGGAPVAATPKKRGTRRRIGTAVVPDEAVPGTDPLPAMPAPKPCVPPPTGDDLGEQGAVASQGLDRGQVRAAMNAFVGHTLRCFPPEAAAGTVMTDLVVGCDGRVTSVTVSDDGGFDAATIGCVRDVLGRTPFPAHDLPDGYTFGYPLSFSFDE